MSYSARITIKTTTPATVKNQTTTIEDSDVFITIKEKFEAKTSRGFRLTSHQLVLFGFFLLLAVTAIIWYLLYRANAAPTYDPNRKRRKTRSSKQNQEGRSIPKLELDTSPSKLLPPPYSLLTDITSASQLPSPQLSAQRIRAPTSVPAILDHPSEMPSPTSSGARSMDAVTSNQISRQNTYEFKSSPFDPQFKPIIPPKTLAKCTARSLTESRTFGTSNLTEHDSKLAAKIEKKEEEA